LTNLPIKTSEATTVIAETANGKLRGARVDGVTIFRGIPYGGPTEGPARFLPPARPGAWMGVRDCMVTGPRCVQGPGVLFLDPLIGEYFSGGRPDRAELAQQPESENCLNLNVLTPTTQTPVCNLRMVALPSSR
jgi:para-nitrobenzyl esterase